MKEFLARLNPMERRFVVGVAVAFFLVGNIVFVWPHFADWGETRTAMNNWLSKLDTFQRGADKLPRLRTEVAKYQKEGDTVPVEEEAVHFFNLITRQAAASSVAINDMGSSRQTGTNQFFVEVNQTISTVSGEKQLVDFLYHLGAGTSLIRVKALSVQPDPPHQQLTARITLVASYQRKTPIPASRAAAPAAAPTANKTAAQAGQKPTAPAPNAAAPKPPAPKTAVPNPLLPKPGSPFPAGRAPATNKPNPLKPNKQ